MIVNFENAASHNTLCKWTQIYERLVQKRLAINFLFLFTNHINSVSKFPLQTFVV